MARLITYLLLVIALLIGIASTSDAQTKQSPEDNVVNGYVYRDLGTYNYAFSDGSFIGVHAYITKTFNTSGLYTQYKYAYTLIAESKSLYDGTYRATWLYGARVFVNDGEASLGQYPQGFTSYVKTSPTILYYWYTNDEQVPTYYITWANSAYETK